MRGDPPEEPADGRASLGGHQARVLREEHEVAGDPLRIEEPRLLANGVEARALPVALRRVGPQGGLLGTAAGREDEEEVVLEVEHVVGARRQGTQGLPARLLGPKYV